MANRTVKVDLVAGTGGYDGPVKASTQTTLQLGLAQKQQAAAAKAAALETVSAAQQIAVAEKTAALAAAEATAKEVEGDQAQIAAKKEVEGASKALATQEKASATAIAAAQRESAAAGKEVVAAQKAIEGATKKTADSYANTGKRMTVAGLALVGVFGLAEKATSDFDTAVSGVGAVANASAAQMDQLRGAALQAGKDTAFTATQAADAEGELVKAGVSVADTLNGALKGSLSLAAAGQLDLAQSATISANAMNTFNLKGKDVGHIADVLAAGANKSAADVTQLAYGMQQGGLVASQMGLSLEDTVATLSAFADRGLEGADAGTSMKTMLERLAAPTTAAKDQMKALGIDVYDASGKFVGITSIAGQLHDKLGSLSEAQRNTALQTIFGTDAIRAANVLYSLGAQGMQGYISAVNDSGAAGRMAGAQMDNLSGDLKQLKGSLDVALIQSGSGANSVLRDMTQGATAAVNAFANLPKPVQEAATAFAGGAGSTLLLVGGITTGIGKISTFRKGLQEAGEVAEGFKGGVSRAAAFMTGPWGLAIMGAAAVIGIFASKQNAAQIQVTDFTQALKDDGNALGEHTQAAVTSDLATKGLYDSFGKLGVSVDTVTTAAMGNSNSMQQLADETRAAIKATDDLGTKAKLMTNLSTIMATASGLHEQQRAQLQAAAAAQQAATASDDASVAASQLAQNTKQAAAAAMAQTAASRTAAEAQAAEADSTSAVTSATKGATSAKKSSTTATKDSAAETKAATAATKAHTTAEKAANTAANDAAKAAAAQAKAQSGTTNAVKAHTAAQDANTRSSNASLTATQDATNAKNADAKVTAAQAKAASDAARAAGQDAAAQAAAAQAAREAAFNHQIGTEALKGWAEASNVAGHAADHLDDSVSNEVTAMKDAQSAASALKDDLDALNGVHISAARAAVDVQDKVASLTKALDANGKSLDITTQAGRDNMTAILDTADAMNKHAEAVTQETGSVYAGNAALKASRDEFDKVLQHAGLTTAQIQNFDDTILNLPKVVPITITVDDGSAVKTLVNFKNSVGDLTGVHIGGTTGKALFSRGGLVEGGGTETSDSIPAQLSRREYVLSARAVSRIGVANLDRLNFGGSPPTYVRPQFAGGVGGTGAHAAAATASRSLQLTVSGGADGAVASMIMNLIRTNQIQLSA